MLPQLFIKQYFIESRREKVSKTELEKEFNISITGTDVIKILNTLRNNSNIFRAVYLDGNFEVIYN